MSDVTELAQFFGFTASVAITTVDGTVFHIPNTALLDDDQQERWEALQFDLERCDRDDDGELISPYRIDGEPLTPSYNVRLGQVVFGEDGYEKFKAAGGSGNRIALEWARMNKEHLDGIDPEAD
ncbi:hypothetical protein QN239_26820 [Mycolicibacterium sp. Y3]